MNAIVSYAATLALICVFWATPAFAIDGADFVDRLRQLAGPRGYLLEYGSIEDTADGAFVVRDIELIGEKQPDDPVRIHMLAVTGAKDLGADGVAMDELKLTGLSYSGQSRKGEDVIVALDNLSATGLHLPETANAGAPPSIYPVSSSSIDTIRIVVDGKDAFDLRDLSAQAHQDEAAGTYRTSGRIGSITFHTDTVTDAQARSRFEALGIETIELSARFGANWDMNSGRLELTEYVLDAPKYGRFDLTLAIDGYTRDVAAAIRSKSARPETDDSKDPEAAKAAPGAMMETIGQLKLAKARLVYHDVSLTRMMLERQAREMGGSTGDMVDMASAMALVMTQPLENLEFSMMLGGAVRAFLANPRNLSIALQPDTPVALTEIFGAAITDPKSLVDRLGVTVEANE